VSAPTGWATARAPLEVPEALSAPLFKLLLDDLAEGERRVILDLGAPSTPMLALLGRSPCRVEIADLAREGGIARLNAEAEPMERAETAEALLPAHTTHAAVDTVFCWDLLNYLHPDAIAALIGAVARRARPGAIVHALVVYSERTMPEQPLRFLPAEDGRLVSHGRSATEIKAPRYSPEDLGRTLGSFEIERARLLANGMQEYLFRLGT
jgi:hypothetical protein